MAATDTRSSDGPNAGPAEGTNPRIRWSWWTVVMLVLLAWNIVSLLPLGGTGNELTYSAFRSQVAAGNVAAVDFDGQTITGTLRHALPAAASASGQASATGAAAPSGSAALSFETVIPAFGDPTLLPALTAAHVAVSAEDTTDGSGIIPDLLIGLLPVVLLVGFGIWSARRFQQAGTGIMGFGGSKPRVYTAERPKVTFADVAGEDDAKAELREIVEYLRDASAFERVGARLPRGVLLVGPPGTGKTLLARAVAGEARVPFFSISGSEFVEMFIGVGASRVRDLFAKAKADGPAIVFMDEIDAVGRQRSTGPFTNDEREQTLNQLLVEMDGFDEETRVVVIAATNRPDVLDPALLRPGRFDRQVTVAYPDREGREEILRIHSRSIRLAPSVDLSEVARQTSGFSGADLANLANEAALQAARAGREAVERADFGAAMDRVMLGNRQPSLTDRAERRLVAYHEGGHALVAILTPGADPVDKVTIVPHGQVLGATRQLPEEDRHNYRRDFLLGRLAVLLAGRAAEELVFGQPTTGAESDLREATRLARQMVAVWGMTGAVGPVSFEIDDVGRPNPLQPGYAEATGALIDEGVRDLLDEARDAATRVLSAHREALDAIAEELAAHEIIDRATLVRLVSDPRLAGVQQPALVGEQATVCRPAPAPATSRRPAAARATPGRPATAGAEK